MRSLFSKIFIWFWLANVLLTVAMTFVMRAMVAADPPKFDSVLSNTLALYGRGAVLILEREGPEALERHMTDSTAPLPFPVFLLDDRGDELGGDLAPRAARELAVQMARDGTAFVTTQGSPRFMGVRLSGSRGGHYAVVGQLPSGSLQNLVTEPRLILMQLVAVILTAGVLCYGLSGYLTAPLRRLSAAARQLARGDLKVRAGTRVGSRRDEIGRLGRDFDDMAERIESLMSSQQRLIRDMSHELRSPLARLSVALGLAVQTSGPESKDALDRIEREAHRLDKLIEEMLTLSRLEGSDRVVGDTSIDLSDLVREVVADADFEAVSLGRHVRVLGCDSCTTKGTPELLRSAIENVIRNSIRYTPEGTQVDVTLHVERMEGNSRAIARVRDHGPGVPEDAIPHIFRPFYRVGDDRNRQTGGVGLGLAIAQQAVRLHGGSISAANAPDGGLVIDISLPLIA